MRFLSKTRDIISYKMTAPLGRRALLLQLLVEVEIHRQLVPLCVCSTGLMRICAISDFHSPLAPNTGAGNDQQEATHAVGLEDFLAPVPQVNELTPSFPLYF